MKKTKGFSLKDKTISLIERISEIEDDNLSKTIENAVEYYAREKYGLE